MSAPGRARLQLAAAAVLFSTGGAAIKAADFVGWQITCLRSGIAAVAIWLIAGEARHGWTWRVFLVGVAYAVTLTLFVLANRLTTSANTIFLQSTAPLYLALLAPWLLHERTRRQDLLVMVAIVVGLGLTFHGTEQPHATAPDPGRGNLLAAASGLFWALTVCGLRWMSARPERGSAAAAVVAGNFIAFAMALPFALPVGAHSALGWGLIIYLGVFQIAVAYTFVTRGLRVIPALEASLILLIEPMLNPVWSWVFHGERPSPWTLLGGVLILGATMLKALIDARAPSPVVEA
ncbi:MAG TPA: EamA family transporter [Gemmatimonadales bacterium]|nr:EamA family transporter [Gemmatimonadales bacterium]